MHINASIKNNKKSKDRLKKAKLTQSSFSFGQVPINKSFSSHGRMENIEVKTLIVLSKNENINKSYKNKKPLKNENWTKRKCLCCGKIFDSWGIGNRLCQRCK